MAKKSVVRNAFKMWPKNKEIDRMSKAVEISNENEGFVAIETSPEISDYTAVQKEYFDKLITNNDALGMFCFFPQLDEGVQTNLFNSFEKGKKGTYQKIVNNLTATGREKIEEYQMGFQDCLERDSEFDCQELKADLPQEALDYILDHANSELAAFIRVSE